jgi:Ca2+-binding RTX toxin-like protein
MRRILSLKVLLVGAVFLLLGSGIAYALSITCDGAGDQDPDNGQCLGTDGNDKILGTSGVDEIQGLKGKDNIRPQSGNDKVDAGPGDDQVGHSFGNDIIYGGDGNDTLRGGRGGDHIYGGNGADLIDCASLESRGDTDDDIAYADSLDTVVDCPEPYQDDPTSDEPPL